MARARDISMLLGLAVFAAGCSSSSKSTTGVVGTGSSGGSSSSGSSASTTGGVGTTGAGSTSGSTAGTTSGGKPDAGVACATDLDCAASHGVCLCGGTRPCAAGGGVCTVTSETCQPRNGGSDCSTYNDCEDAFGDLLCYCRPDATVDAGGLCYLPQPACGACSQDADCGNTPLINPPSFCLPLDGGSFCVAEEVNACNGATVATPLDGTVLCVPICDSCPCVGGCSSNADCPAIDAGVCSPSHFCVAPCAADGCAAGEVCNVLDTYLDPGLTVDPFLSQLYGGGQCGPVCTTAASCASYEIDGGVPLACENDPTELNGDRCRPLGCLDSLECGSAVVAPNYISWCDVFADGGTCITAACRLGLTTGSDCQAGYYCVADGGSPMGADGSPATGECVVQPCTLMGADDSCAIDQLCCGEGDAGASTCSAGTAPGSCYAAPNPPWCATCDPSGSPFGIAACNRPANAVQFGSGLGTGYCQATPTGGLCEPACDRTIPSSCATGFACTDQIILVGDCGQCGTNPCQDAGSNSMGGAFLCGCVDDAGTGCPGQGTTPVACTPQTFCSYGSYCQATAHACP